MASRRAGPRRDRAAETSAGHRDASSGLNAPGAAELEVRIADDPVRLTPAGLLVRPYRIERAA